MYLRHVGAPQWGSSGSSRSRGSFCKFAGVDAVRASFEGDGRVRCVTPAGRRAGSVGVGLVIDGALVFVASGAFAYHAEMAVYSLDPPVGVLGGGTLVRIRGSGFGGSAPLVVRFGAGAVVVAKALSTTMLECASPERAVAGLLPVEVSQNGQDFTSDELVFEYQAGVRLDELAPPRGVSSGGTSVVMIGVGAFLSSQDDHIDDQDQVAPPGDYSGQHDEGAQSSAIGSSLLS